MPRRAALADSGRMFFFSSSMGCLTSLIVSLVGTLLLLSLTGVIDLF